MIFTYASSYISGMGLVVEKALKEQIPDVCIIQNMDGFIIYKTSKKENVLSLKFFNNTFLLISKINVNNGQTFQQSVNNILNKLKIDANIIKSSININKQKTFKIIAIDKNQPTNIDYNKIKPLEKYIENNVGIKTSFNKHDLDFVFMKRDDNIIMFLLKLTYNRITEKSLNHGELRPELAYLLSYTSNIKSSDIIMDPFCGYGSIPKQIVKNFKYNMLFASDINETLIKKLKVEYKNNNKNLFIKKRDALDLSYFQDSFIDKIITDPPWNIFNKSEKDYSIFYSHMLNEFYRILKNHGTCTLIMGNPKDFESALKTTNFILDKKFNILVNGKKANVYKLIKSV